MEGVTPRLRGDRNSPIAERFLVPRELEETRIDSEAVRIGSDALTRIIREYTREAGVRGLTRSPCRPRPQAGMARAEGIHRDWNIRATDIPQVLGRRGFVRRHDSEASVAPRWPFQHPGRGRPLSGRRLAGARMRQIPAPERARAATR